MRGVGPPNPWPVLTQWLQLPEEHWGGRVARSFLGAGTGKGAHPGSPPSTPALTPCSVPMYEVKVEKEQIGQPWGQQNLALMPSSSPQA